MLKYNLETFTSIYLILNNLEKLIKKMQNKYYITTPIYYVNDKPHLGHAYTSLVADTIARYNRLLENDVMFVTGTDEHGQKVEEAAKKNKSPIEFVDNVSEQFRDLAKVLDLTNDDFIRTSESRHKSYVRNIWRKLEKTMIFI